MHVSRIENFMTFKHFFTPINCGEQAHQPSVCIIYSSVTGNTRQLAEALAQATHFPLFSVQNPPDLTQFPILALGFWVKRGLPDCAMWQFMATIHAKQIFFFCTHAAWPDSEHMQKCRDNVVTLLKSQQNVVLGYFTCQGRVRAQDGHVQSHHPLTQERLMRLEEAQHHPNQSDCAQVVQSFAEALAKVQGV